MDVLYCDQFVLPLPPGHRFPMEKYRLLRERVAGANRGQFKLRIPQRASTQHLALVHEPNYIERVLTGRLEARQIRALGFPWSRELVERSRRSVGATIAACATAAVEGRAASLAGGTHHAFADHPRGFCVFNDVAVAARCMQTQIEQPISRVLIVDCDVHQGDGTAAIFHDDPSVFTFSIHGARNYPFTKHSSDLDIGLPDATGDDVYLEVLGHGLQHALTGANADLVIYLAGADPYFDDQFGRIALTKQGLAARDQLVYEHCERFGLPVAIVMAGGYAKNIDDVVDIHFQSVQLAAKNAYGTCAAVRLHSPTNGRTNNRPTRQ